MFVGRNPIFQWLECVHPIWNLRSVELRGMGDGRVGVSGIWSDDGTDNGRERYPDFLDVFSFDLRTTSKWDLQTALYQRLENHRKRLWPG
jgi:hypothetical protein